MAKYVLVLLFIPLIILLCTATGSYGTSSDAPRIRTIDINLDKLAESIGNRRLILMHEEQKADDLDRSIRYVSAMAVLDQPPSKVRETVLDFTKYKQRVPYYKSASVKERTDQKILVEFKFILQMAIISPTISYDIVYKYGPDNDLIWKRKSGDIQQDRGRWEFIPLSDNRTLLVYTGWTNFSGLGWTVDTILWAQPALETAMPVMKAATLIDSFKDYYRSQSKNENSSDTESDTELPSEPKVPTFADKKNLNVDVLSKISSHGTPMFIHPPRWIRTNDGKKMNFIFTTTFDVLNYPIEVSKKLTTQFDKTARLIPQAQSVDVKTIENGYIADWHFDLGFGIFSVPVYYRVQYDWKTERVLTYKRIKGDIDHIYGSLEWYPLSSNKTIYFFSSASQIGEKAPSIIQMANIIPNRQIFMGVSLGAAGVEKAVRWANDLETLPKSIRESEPIHGSSEDTSPEKTEP